jgi:hypothetical protein
MDEDGKREEKLKAKEIAETRKMVVKTVLACYQGHEGRKK